MELTEARQLLAVEPTAAWDEVKASYRRLIADAHPDRAGDGATARAARLNDAYRTLGIANREGRLNETAAPRSSAAAPTSGQRSGQSTSERRRDPGRRLATDVRLVDRDTLVFDTPPAETFRRLMVAADGLGEIVYVDRSAAIFETVVTLEDATPASLVFNLQWRAHDATCEAFATLEAMDRPHSYPVGGVLEQIAELLPEAHGW